MPPLAPPSSTPIIDIRWRRSGMMGRPPRPVLPGWRSRWGGWRGQCQVRHRSRFRGLLARFRALQPVPHAGHRGDSKRGTICPRWSAASRTPDRPAHPRALYGHSGRNRSRVRSLLPARTAVRAADQGPEGPQALHQRPGTYPLLEPLIGEAIDPAAIVVQWPEFMRLKASIQAGTVLPSVILRKLAAAGPGNALSRALRALGPIERTMFTLQG